jgi:predicted CXXCH cytochrome family protein
MKNNSMKRISAGLLCILLLAVWGCTQEEDLVHTAIKEPTPLITEYEIEYEKEYVGSVKCKECHWKEYDSWKHTLHSKFMQLPGDFTILGDFYNNNKLTVQVTDKAPTETSKEISTSVSEAEGTLVVSVTKQLPSQPLGEEITTTMWKKGQKYYVNTIGPDWQFRDYEITAAIGINRKQNYLTTFPNGQQHVLPVEWDVKKEQWVDYYGMENHYPGDGKYWSDRGRLWQYQCAGCHATGLEINYDKTTDFYETSMVEPGIGCEACHGAGSKHVEAASTYYDYEKDTIVNPSKLPWKLRAMVCGQCHSHGVSTAKISPAVEGAPERYSFPFGYQVGQPLYLYFEDEPEEEHLHNHQFTEWQGSRHEEAGVLCTTCHDVHQAGLHKPPNKAQTKLASNNLCTSCHKTSEKRAAHRIHTYGSCIACHMPKSTEDVSTHSFEFISPEVSLQAGGVDKQPNSCSGCHHHKDSSLIGLIEFLDGVKKQDMPKPYAPHLR